MRLLKADYKFRRVYELDAKWLAENNITALILDVDNTLTEHGSQCVEDQVMDWLAEMRRLGVKLIVVSNNRNRRVKPFAEKLGLEYIANGMKPSTSGIRRAMAQINSGRENTAMVGDQIFTDVLGGNLAGLCTVLLEPISFEHGRFMRLKRRLERHVK